MNIPDDIKKKIQEEATLRNGEIDYDFRNGAEYGYQLAMSECVIKLKSLPFDEIRIHCSIYIDGVQMFVSPENFSKLEKYIKEGVE